MTLEIENLVDPLLNNLQILGEEGVHGCACVCWRRQPIQAAIQ